jgi:diguanylate cyclase (GGDEF)-like protein/PAS domain S-box-containing protein
MRPHALSTKAAPGACAADTSPAEAGKESARQRQPAPGPPSEAQAPAGEPAQIERLFEMTSDLLATISTDGRFLLLNPAWETVLGWSRAELLARPINDLIHPDDVERTLALMLTGSHRDAQLENFTNRFRHRDGEWRSLAWSGRCDGEVWYTAARDVSDRHWLERQALHDPLTKLPNRLLLMDRTHQALTRLHRSTGLVALLFIDLDKFKAINDRYGHDAGDRLLLLVAERLGEMMRDSDTVARLGGDEFVVLAEDLEDETEAHALAERVLAALKKPFPIGPAQVSMPASVGVAIAHGSDANPEAMLREADVAMYRAKGAGGHRLEVFGESLRKEVTAHLEIEERLLQALPREELRMTYQPIMPLAGGRAVACEALLRWNPSDEEGATIEQLLPTTFLPRASSDLIRQIGDWVLETACAQADAWRRAGIPVPVAVNISERELGESDLAERICRELAKLRLPGRALCIEVSEDAVIHDLERAREALAAVRRLGVTIALDNFGIGESSLSLPRSLPLDMIKLDRTLIETFEGDRKTRAMVAATIALAKEARLQAVAVGIETNRQLALARELGCAVGQGYLLHRPDLPGRLRLTSEAGAVTSAPWRPRVRLGESTRRP